MADSVTGVAREAVILAGGPGTRLRSAVPDVPKVLAPVAGRPFLAHVLGFLERNNFARVILAVSYRRDEIIKALGKNFGTLKLEYSTEDQPLGTGGALWLAARRITEGQNFFIFNGDTYTTADIEAMEKSMARHHADIVMAVHTVNDTGRYGLIETDDKRRVTGFREKVPGKNGTINAGVYLMRHDLPRRFSFPGAFSLEIDILQAHLRDLCIVAVPIKGYFIDIGVPEDYERANRELA